MRENIEEDLKEILNLLDGLSEMMVKQSEHIEFCLFRIYGLVANVGMPKQNKKDFQLIKTETR